MVPNASVAWSSSAKLVYTKWIGAKAIYGSWLAYHLYMASITIMSGLTKDQLATQSFCQEKFIMEMIGYLTLVQPQVGRILTQPYSEHAI